MFSIRVLPRSRHAPRGPRLGEITVGGFTEEFACYPVAGETLARMEARWREQLRELIGGVSAVALAHDPRFAWVLYREDERCYVQQRLSPDGQFRDILPRCTQTEEGQRVSEWDTTIAEIEQFVRA